LMPQQAVVDYVLKPPRPDERVAIESAVQRAVDASADISRGDMERAMMALHTRAADTRETKT
jgi:peptidyl-tRNA hydrolase, PTH1 family